MLINVLYYDLYCCLWLILNYSTRKTVKEKAVFFSKNIKNEIYSIPTRFLKHKKKSTRQPITNKKINKISFITHDRCISTHYIP